MVRLPTFPLAILHLSYPELGLRYTLYHDVINPLSHRDKGYIATQYTLYRKITPCKSRRDGQKRDFRVLFHVLSVTNFSTKNHDNDSGNGRITVFHRQTIVFDVECLEFGVTRPMVECKQHGLRDMRKRFHQFTFKPNVRDPSLQIPEEPYVLS